MSNAQRFPYVEMDASLGAASVLPYVPLRLAHEQKLVSISALVDSGAALNVLPYDAGIQLGAVWEQQTVPVQLTGNLSDSRTRLLQFQFKFLGLISNMDCDLKKQTSNSIKKLT